MYSRAQAGLEYLVTYGWALAIVAVIVGLLVFIVGSPSYDVSFSSSDPTAILVKGGTIVGGKAEIVLQNITGGPIEVTKAVLSGAFSGCKLNDKPFTSDVVIDPPVTIVSGGMMYFEDINYNGEETGAIDIDYTDAVGLQKSIRIRALIKVGKCKYLNCDDGNPCTKDKCKQGECEYENWHDGKECDTGKQCLDGNCVGVNQPPIADAGPDQSVSEGEEVTLNAAGSLDFDGTITAYEWKEGETVLSTEVSFTKIDFSVGEHAITLTVTDNEDANGTDTVNINVVPPGLFFAKELWSDSLPGFHSCAILNDNSVKCWGTNVYGELGDGTTTDRLTPVSVSGLGNVTAIALGTFHSCALLSDGSVKCWGGGTHGRLGNGSTGHRSTPVSVVGIDNAIAISLGWSHSCALLSDGSIKCWGYNWYGQVGDGTSGDPNVSRPTPVSVVGIDNAVAIALGGHHSCAIISNTDGHIIKCWGRGGFGQLGNHSFSNQSTPVSISKYEISNAAALSLGGDHSCTLLSDGRVKCWGWNEFGQLGSGTIGVDRYSPITVPGLSNVTAVASGEWHNCVGFNDGSIKCWGNNNMGQLGDDTTTRSLTPVSVVGIDNAVDIALGAQHSCAQLNDNSVKCWGNNYSAQLGDGTEIPRYTPVQVIT